jgi:hypothetical protein
MDQSIALSGAKGSATQASQAKVTVTVQHEKTCTIHSFVLYYSAVAAQILCYAGKDVSVWTAQ